MGADPQYESEIIQCSLLVYLYRREGLVDEMIKRRLRVCACKRLDVVWNVVVKTGFELSVWYPADPGLSCRLV